MIRKLPLLMYVDMLLTQPIDPKAEMLPSPNLLRKKILIKVYLHNKGHVVCLSCNGRENTLQCNVMESGSTFLSEHWFLMIISSLH